MTELRQHMRLELCFPVEATLPDGSVFRGETKNISFGGVLLHFKEAPALNKGDRCLLSIILHQGENPITIDFETELRHASPNGMGMQFIGFHSGQLDSYRHFKNVMVINSPDPDRLLDELHNNPCLLTSV